MFPHAREEESQTSESVTGSDTLESPPTERHTLLQWIPRQLVELDREENTASIDRKRLKLKRLWNSALLVHTLISEVLTRIFANVQVDPRFSRFELPVHSTTGERHGARPVTDWHGLMLVCSYWRNLLVSNPAFWRVIDTKRHIEWTKLCLERSAAASLDVHLGNLDRCPLDMLYPHVHRFQKLFFAGLSESQMKAVLPPLFGGGMPLLEHLDVSTGTLGERPSVDLNPYLTSHRSPRLQSLVLFRVVIPGDKNLYAQLRTLSLSYCVQDISSRLDSFIDVLEGCVQLEDLTLYYTLDTLSGDSEWTPPGPVPRRQPIPLPSLRRFWLDARGPGTGLIPYFLAHFNIPALETFYVASAFPLEGGGAGLTPNDEKTISTLLPPNRSQALPILSETTRLFTTFVSELWSIHAECPRGVPDARGRQEFSAAIFKLSFYTQNVRGSWDPWMARGVGDLAQCFGGSPLTVLDLGAEDHSSATVALWEGVFQTFSLLEVLIVGRGPTAELSNVFRGLHAASHADSPVACLNLTRVSAEGLGTVATYEAMGECFRHRADRGARLEVLDLSMHNDNNLTSEERSRFVEDLRKVVGLVRVRGW